MAKKAFNPIVDALEWVLGSTPSEPRAAGVRFDAVSGELLVKHFRCGVPVKEQVISGVRAAKKAMGEISEALVVNETKEKQ